MIKLTSKKVDKIVKKSQGIGRGFRRMDYSPEELNAKGQEIDITQFFNSPNSIMDLVLDLNSINFSSRDDEEKIFEIWQRSNKKNNLEISESEGRKLLNRGYLTTSNGKYEFTQKALKSIKSSILAKKPFFEWDTINKTAAFKKKSSLSLSMFSRYYSLMNNDNGSVSAYEVPNDEMTEKALRSLTPTQRGQIKKNSLKVIIPAEFFNNSDNNNANRELDPSVNPNPYVNTEGPPPPEATYDLHTFTNSKLLGMIKNCKNKGLKEVIANELGNRGLKTRLIAHNEATRAMGLMHSEPLKNDECALFIFSHYDESDHRQNAHYQYMKSWIDPSKNPGFWNKNVSFPIDVAFYDKDGILVAIRQLEANQLEPVFSGSNDIRWVIETQKGWYKKNGLDVGSSIWEVMEGLPRM